MKTSDKSRAYIEEENKNNLLLQEPVVAYACEAAALPNDVAFARVVDGVLQVTPDIEEEIAEVDRGETVSMDEFKTMFSLSLKTRRVASANATRGNGKVYT